jgi:hypothetical protein
VDFLCTLAENDCKQEGGDGLEGEIVRRDYLTDLIVGKVVI